MQLLTDEKLLFWFCHVFWTQTHFSRGSAKSIDVTVVEISMWHITIESKGRLSRRRNADPAEPVWLIIDWCVSADSLIGLFISSRRSHRNMTYRRRRSFVSGSRRWPACRSEIAFRKASRMESYCASELVNILGHVGKVPLLKNEKQ